MLRLLSDENFNGDIVRGLLLRQPTLNLQRGQDLGLEGADDPAILEWAATRNLTLVGAAFPRTGTMSVKHALERLGVGRCYHFHDIQQSPNHIPIWEAIGNGRMPDWQSLLEGYAVTLDAPMCLYWRELTECFPNARVLLLLRDPETWYDSVYTTVYAVTKGPGTDTNPALKMARRILFHQYFNGEFGNRDYAINIYCQYCDEVRQTIPEDRLLEYSITEGWNPLCDFLGCDAPNIPFPNRNTRDDFLTRTTIKLP